MKFVLRALTLSVLLAGSACAQNVANDLTAAPAAPADSDTPAASAAPKRVAGKVNVTTDTRNGNTVVTNGGNIFIRSKEIAPVKKEKGSYLGISTSSPSAALRYQIGLKPGFGLVVDSVEAASPAEEAGLKRYDILAKFDDQQLINSDQFLVLVRAKTPGESCTFAVMREGKTVTLNAKTVERDVVPISDLISSAKNPFISIAGAGQYESTLTTARALMNNARDNPWSTYAKKQIIDDVSGQTWTFSWDDGQLLRADYTDNGQKKVFMYRFDKPEQATLPDQVKKALDSYLERKKTTVNDIYKSITPAKIETPAILTPVAPGI